MTVNTIYAHLRNLGAGSENSYFITRDLTLQAKHPFPIRFILQILSKIPLFTFIKERTDIDQVVHAVRSEAIEGAAHDEKGDFVTKVLLILKQNRDPHLETFQKINQLRHRVHHDIRSQAVREELLPSLEAIEASYFQESNTSSALERLEAQIATVVASEKAIDDAAHNISSSPLSNKTKGAFNARLEDIRRMPLLTTDSISLVTTLNHDIAEKIADEKAKQRLITLVKGKPSPTDVLASVVFFPFGLLALAYPDVDEENIDLAEVDRCLARGIIDKREKNSGYTPLIYAAYNGLPNVAAHLVSKGASTEKKEDKGYNAYTMARYYLIRYRKTLSDLEQKPITALFTAEQKQKDLDFQQTRLAKYQQLVDLLSPITEDHTMPESYF